MAKKASKKTLKLQCDILVGKIVRARGGCQECGSYEVTQCAHGFSRSYMATRWDETNLYVLCRAHHLYFTYRPLEWEDWMRRQMGDDAYESLRAKAIAGGMPDLEELRGVLKERLELIESAA